jgi:hypothetical protein
VALPDDPDGDGMPGARDRCPAAAHRTSDGCAPFVTLTVTTPQRIALTRKLYVRRIATNLSGRMTVAGTVRARGRLLNVRLRAARIAVGGDGPARATLTMSAATRRIIARRIARGRTEVDVVARIGARRATARVRIRA